LTLQKGDDPIWRGYLYTVILSVAALVAAMADSQYWYKLNLVGLRLKTALSTAIYKKSLNLSNSSRREKTGTSLVKNFTMAILI
jgi:ATP-binding cassette subfamily C (CFTR/MRP) protein 1